MEYKRIISSLIEYYVIDVITFQGSIVTRGSHYDWQWHRRVRSRKTSAPHTTLLPPTETEPRWRHPLLRWWWFTITVTHSSKIIWNRPKQICQISDDRYQRTRIQISVRWPFSLSKPCSYDRGGAILSAQLLLAWDLKDSLNCDISEDIICLVIQIHSTSSDEASN